ncbi:MAG TPA: glycerophosphodiester phosphodiesterase [Burkholderiales bacterium]|nr:glycerophosphodiester phosphodiesterase [Burkholderiales bacterium]
MPSNAPRRLWPFPRIIAHRGGGVLAPENTLAGIRLARNLGFTAVEFDVKLSADRVPVLMHDDTLERTTDGSGAVAAMSYEALARLDAGGWFANEFGGERVPGFAAASALCREAGVWANVEIKPNPGEERETGEAVARMARLLWAGSQPPPLLSSFSPLSLEAAAVEAPDLPRALLVVEPPQNWLAQLERLQCVALHASHRHLDPALVKAVHASGRGVLAYTVNDSELALDLLGWEVDALVTDQLDAITPAFA